jgi:hypothetical protein
MKKKFLPLFFLINILISQVFCQNFLKSVLYDFDGLNIGQTNLPDGDYRNDDLKYQVVATPLVQSNMLGDRVLECKLDWNIGRGEFGKATFRFFELDAEKDRVCFYIYNPTTNQSDAKMEVMIGEDDDQDNLFDPAKDDIWKIQFNVPRKEEWQLTSLPISSFVDANVGGNGIFDAAYTNAAGMVFQVGIKFFKNNSTASSETYYLDMISFTEGDMPTGNTILDLPGKTNDDACHLGAYSLTAETKMDLVPSEIESLFPENPRKIKYVNTFFPFSSNGSSNPHKYPGEDVKILIENGYIPILTWEPLFAHLTRLDPAQPRLQNIINGEFDEYIKNFGNKLKELEGPVIMRILHEFEGNWYPWSLIENGQDPQKYITAYRRVVDLVRGQGANNVKWMWCVNSDPAPYRAYNWIVSCYPGDDYVDMVATDIYNHPDYGVPDWKSFRYTGIESYYYLNKYFSHKPLYICEVGCRERYDSEPSESQSKAEWLKMMDKDIQSFFHKSRALIFFNKVKEHDWRIQSSENTLTTVRENIWNDDYYFGMPTVGLTYPKDKSKSNLIYPNPSNEGFMLAAAGEESVVKVYSYMGQMVFSTTMSKEAIKFGNEFPKGIYIVNVHTACCSFTQKVIKN